MKYINCDITSVERGIIVHGVNCQRVMGSGVAKAIRDKWPQVYSSYINFRPELKDKELLGLVNIVIINDQLWIANCFTQVNYGRDGKVYADINAISQCIDQVIMFAAVDNLPIYMPKIGSGLGGLKWEDVSSVLLQLEQYITGELTICEWS